MTDRITILVATMSGTAEMVADELAAQIADAGGEAHVLRMEKASPAMIAGGTWIICSSTYGTGDVPDNGMALYEALGAEKPSLAAVRYGVVALGDSVYPTTFCFGGKKFDELFASLGARRVGSRLEIDARSGAFPEDLAGEWVQQWLKQLEDEGAGSVAVADHE